MRFGTLVHLNYCPCEKDNNNSFYSKSTITLPNVV